jgi:hypothetical protein
LKIPAFGHGSSTEHDFEIKTLEFSNPAFVDETLDLKIPAFP